MSVYATSRARTEIMDWWTIVDVLHADLLEELGDEPSVREAADIVLQENIGAEESARSSADTTLQGNIDSEASTRSSADITLQENINAEESARSSADTTLQGNIDSEASTRSSADATLQGNIDLEAAARAGADTALQTQITAVKSTADAAEAALSVLNGTGSGSVTKAVADGIASVIAEAPQSFDTLKEISDWISGHESDAAGMNSAIQTNASAIQTEVTARGNADTTLQGNIDTEAATRAQADLALQAQITAAYGYWGQHTVSAYETVLSWNTFGLTYNAEKTYVIIASPAENRPEILPCGVSAESDGVHIFVRHLSDARIVNGLQGVKWGTFLFGAKKFSEGVPLKINLIVKELA